MTNQRRICRCRNVTYLDIRQAMKLGARNIEDIIKATGAASCCGGCTSEVLSVLNSVCTCNSVSMNEVIEVVNNGANSVDKVGELTKAGTSCGRCIPLIKSVIELKK